ncbi:MAG: DUF1643 domain-containing protein [Salinibacterium sp.]|nr:DUF1643 domain-containing protein [Salinibacterium sp.]
MASEPKRIWHGDIERGACLSDCERYRYTLWRRWGDEPKPEKSPCMVFVMLNPSTADGQYDDPTIRRCMGFADSFGYHAMLVVNLFAFRATNPRDLWSEEDPIGPENDEAIRRACYPTTHRVVAAWGSPKHAWHDRRAQEVTRLLATRLHTLATTKHGHPRHPLYLAADASLSPWSGPFSLRKEATNGE